ncbi:MAG: group I truncated hemoglobin [Betaproteobacteria bacterium]
MIIRLLASVFFVVATGIAAGCASYDTIRADKSLFHDLGGKPGIPAIVSDTIDLAVANPGTKRHFEKIDLTDLKKIVSEQFCALTGGPCKYTGKDMAKAHKGLDLNAAEFNIFVEDLRHALDRNRISESARNRLLALLAPMKRDVLHQ